MYPFRQYTASLQKIIIRFKFVFAMVSAVYCFFTKKTTKIHIGQGFSVAFSDF
jgi:uncharacterized membrane protein YagU involved in acid resistance